MIRLFVALDIPNEIKSKLLELKRTYAGFKWLSGENMHLTLQFIGEVREEEYRKIVDALEDVQMSALELSIKGVGSFGPSSNPKILYASVEENSLLFDLQSEIREKLLEVIQLEKQKFIPHVTLARLKNANTLSVSSFLEANHDFKTPSFSVDTFKLLSSKLVPEGPQYSVEQEFELF